MLPFSPKSMECDFSPFRDIWGWGINLICRESANGPRENKNHIEREKEVLRKKE